MSWTIRDESGSNDTEVNAFTERVWAQYHADRGHPESYDFHSRPVEFVARVAGGEVIGLASGRIKAGVGHLSELLVAGDFRWRGLGGELLEAFERQCRAAGCHKLTVHTERVGPARSFYERHGCRREAVYVRDLAGLDYVRLMKFLDEAGAEAV